MTFKPLEFKSRFVVLHLLMVVLATLGMAKGLVAQPTFTSGVDLVRLGVTVIDRHDNFVTDLMMKDFEVYEGGILQEIRYFRSANMLDSSQPPLHLGLLFDTSSSMEQDLRMSQSAAIKFLNTVTKAEDITLVDFDTEVRVGRYSQNDFPRLIERIRLQKPKGWTALYDALGVYLDGASWQDGQKVLVLFTDGGDTRSAMSFSEVNDLVKASDVTLYAIGFLKNRPRNASLMRQIRMFAEQTGGEVFLPLTADPFDEIYARIVEELNSRYSFGYSSTNDLTDGGWREIEVRLNTSRPDLKGAKIRTRKGYYGPYFKNDF